jgi:hypothetical protein
MSDTNLPPIHTVRGQQVVLDNDLAALYGVLTKRLNEAVGRNADRFPDDFCFQLTREEAGNMRSQIATSKLESTPEEGITPNWSQIATSSRKHRGATYLHWAFTEHGALMAATVLRSPQAVQMSLYVVRAFVRMREELMSSAVIFKRLALIDKKLLEHDIVLQDVVEKLLPLLNPPPEPPKRRIGFNAGGECPQ